MIQQIKENYSDRQKTKKKSVNFRNYIKMSSEHPLHAEHKFIQFFFTLHNTMMCIIYFACSNALLKSGIQRTCSDLSFFLLYRTFVMWTMVVARLRNRKSMKICNFSFHVMQLHISHQKVSKCFDITKKLRLMFKSVHVKRQFNDNENCKLFEEMNEG